MGSTPAVSTKGSLWGAFFVLTGGANPKGSITAQGESRGQIYLSMTEPQPELLGKAEQPPAVFFTQKNARVDFSNRTFHKESYSNEPQITSCRPCPWTDPWQELPASVPSFR